MLVFVAIPVLDGKPCCETVDSLLAEQLTGSAKGDHLLVDWCKGCSLIGHARNVLVRNFLEVAEADRLVFVDADIAWPHGELFKLAHRPQDVVGCTYRVKQDLEAYSLHGEPTPAEDGLMTVQGLPGGFLAISRRALEAIKAKHPERTYRARDGLEYFDFFPTGFTDHTLIGEDYGFCALWRDCGGEVFLDPAPLLSHVGQKTYSGSYAAWTS